MYFDDEILNEINNKSDDSPENKLDVLENKKIRKRRNKHSLVKWLLIILTCGLAISCIVSISRFINLSSQGDTSCVYDEDFNNKNYDDVEVNKEADSEYSLPLYSGDSSGLTIELNQATGEEKSLTELYQEFLPTTVSITVYAGKSAAYGTGIIVTDDGYILTCAHVVNDTEKAVVTLRDDTEYNAELVGMDEQTDLAILKINAHNLTVATFGNSDELLVGESCFVIGDPLSTSFKGSLTNGIISGLNRDVSSNGYSMSLIQTTAAVNSGNSGGPIFNMSGQVIGVVNMKMASSSSASIDNMGLAVPSVTVKAIVEELAQKGSITRAVLGISCYSVSEVYANISEMPEGLWVTVINEASDCEKQGLKRGDIITAVNGQAVSTVSAFKQATAGYSPGDSVTLTVWRDDTLSQELEKENVDSSTDTSDTSSILDDENYVYNFNRMGDISVKLIDSNKLAK